MLVCDPTPFRCNVSTMIKENRMKYPHCIELLYNSGLSKGRYALYIA